MEEWNAREFEDARQRQKSTSAELPSKDRGEAPKVPGGGGGRAGARGGPRRAVAGGRAALGDEQRLPDRWKARWSVRLEPCDGGQTEIAMKALEAIAQKLSSKKSNR